jgi:glucokinase
MYYLGLDVGGTKCTALIGDAEGNIVERITWPSDARRGPEPMIDDLVREGQKLIDRVDGVEAAGVAIGGPLDAARGIIHSPPILPGWEVVPLKDILAERLSVRVHIEHDASACALAEYRWGAGQGAQRLVYLTCGTGFGAGFVFDGRVYRGANGRPSDIGHIRCRNEGPTAYGKRGSAEACCSAAGLGLLAGWRFPDRWPQPPSSQEIATLAREGDPDALQILALSAESVGSMCAIVADMLYTDVIVLGSLARYLGDPWLEQVRQSFDDEAHPGARQICRIVPAGLGDRLQDCSALVVALERD